MFWTFLNIRSQMAKNLMNQTHLNWIYKAKPFIDLLLPHSETASPIGQVHVHSTISETRELIQTTIHSYKRLDHVCFTQTNKPWVLRSSVSSAQLVDLLEYIAAAWVTAALLWSSLPLARNSVRFTVLPLVFFFFFPPKSMNVPKR